MASVAEEGESRAVNLDFPPEAPPSYDDGPPPSYDSVFGKVRKAKEESENPVLFLWQAITIIFCGTLCCGVMIGFLFALPIACIVIGSIYLDDCPRERYIPIYLIVAGVFGLVKALLNSGQQARSRHNKDENDGEEQSKKPNPIDSVLSCFLFAWFIAGSVWVYRVYGDYQSGDPAADDYCHRTLYLYSFWLLTAQYICIAVMLLCCVCAVFIMSICSL